MKNLDDVVSTLAKIRKDFGERYKKGYFILPFDTFLRQKPTWFDYLEVSMNGRQHVIGFTQTSKGVVVIPTLFTETDRPKRFIDIKSCHYMTDDDRRKIEYYVLLRQKKMEEISKEIKRYLPYLS